MKSWPGTYALILGVNRPFTLTVGKLGEIRGDRGFYVYCGSAFGPGGLKARTARHRRPHIKQHWHIDYLKAVSDLHEIWFSYDPENREHDWTRALLTTGDISIPFAGFGSSDCSCTSHLVFSPGRTSYHRFIRTVHRLFPGHLSISRLKMPEPAKGSGPDLSPAG